MDIPAGWCRRNLTLDAMEHFAGRKTVRHGNSVPDGLRGRTAMPDDREARDTKKQGAPVLGIVDPAAEAAERPARQQIADVTRKGAPQLVAEEHLDRFH